MFCFISYLNYQLPCLQRLFWNLPNNNFISWWILRSGTDLNTYFLLHEFPHIFPTDTSDHLLFFGFSSCLKSSAFIHTTYRRACTYKHTCTCISSVHFIYMSICLSFHATRCMHSIKPLSLCFVTCILLEHIPCSCRASIFLFFYRRRRDSQWDFLAQANSSCTRSGIFLQISIDSLLYCVQLKPQDIPVSCATLSLLGKKLPYSYFKKESTSVHISTSLGVLFWSVI